MKALMIAALLATTACTGAVAENPVRAVSLADISGNMTFNQYRASKGLKKLSPNPRLTAAARAHMRDMMRNGFFGHDGTDGSLVGERVTAQGYGWCEVSENLGKGLATERQAVAAWRTSQSHDWAMLRGDVSEYGLAHGKGGYWVLIVAQPC
ncbi:CAP domain-containing protein [Salipiger sp.]|uniref:CAP domain-containing protein n=1 Tax=Salipiger sp. TaxID=2078585 RepID=UPI003A971D33